MNGFDHRFTPSMSMIQMHVASAMDAKPAVKTTYELVQRFLLIGKTQSQDFPTIIASDPAPYKPTTRSTSGRCLSVIHWPARMPRSAVAIAGIVESGPSGSHVFVLTQMWFVPRISRSLHAASVLSG